MKTTQGLAASLGLALAALLGLSQFATSGTIDAVSGASLDIVGGTTTTNSATVKFTFSERNGTWRLYYDVVDHTAMSGFTKFAAISGSSGTMSITATGLTSGTKYYYWLYGSESHGTSSLHTAQTVFTTDAASSVLRRIPASAGNRKAVDPLGRSISQQRGFASVQIDPNGAGIRIEPISRQTNHDRI